MAAVYPFLDLYILRMTVRPILAVRDPLGGVVAVVYHETKVHLPVHQPNVDVHESNSEEVMGLEVEFAGLEGYLLIIQTSGVSRHPSS